MRKTRRRKKTPPRAKRKSAALAEESREVNISNDAISESRFQRNSTFLRLAADAHFVGAMRWMLHGCFACGAFFAILLGVPGLGRLFEEITYRIASVVPQNFIPPGTYIPGVLTPPFLLLLIAGFTAFGYVIGSTPPEIDRNKDTRSPKEKIFEFFFFLALCLALFFLHFRSNYPDYGSIEIISHPVFIFLIVITVSGVSYFVFSRHRSQQLLFFAMYSALAVGFVLFVLGMMAYTIFKSFIYALNH
jgi:hypothetical protein